MSTPASAMSTPASEPIQPNTRAGMVTIAGTAILVAALLSFLVLQYAAPPFSDPDSVGVNPIGVSHFNSALDFTPLHPIDATRYALSFKGLLLAIWIGYGGLLFGVLQGAKVGVKPYLVLICAVAAVFAVFCPPLLSSDSYAYVAWARLPVLYGQNPYTQPPLTYLSAHHDPVAAYLGWDFPAVYGPVWTLLSMGMTQLLHGAGLWRQVVAMKLLEVGALLIAAFSGRAIADRFAPGRGKLAFVAIGLNPLFLIEGPGNGHNDLLLISLFLAAVMFQLKNRPILAALALGLSVGIKLITLIVVPWMIWECCRGKPKPEKVRLSMAVASLALLPTILGYIPFWAGAATFTGLRQRTVWMLGKAAAEHDLYLSHWLARHGVWKAAIPALLTIHTRWPELLIFAGLSVALLLRRKDGEWMTAWGFMAVFLMYCTVGTPYAWYMCWYWPVFLARWDRRHLALSTASFALGLAWECAYAKAFLSTPPT